MKIATWNINSIRLRKENVINFLKNENIDIILTKLSLFFASKNLEIIFFSNVEINFSIF